MKSAISTEYSGNLVPYQIELLDSYNYGQQAGFKSNFLRCADVICERLGDSNAQCEI